MPVDFPPWSTVYNFFATWAAAGVTIDLLDALRERVRIAEGRTATPTAAVIDSQSVRAAETVWRSSRGWDAVKKVNGRKRHLAVDTMGLLICVLVTAANIQDRDGARPLLTRLATVSHRIRLVWADAGYAGALSDWARDTVNVLAAGTAFAFANGLNEPGNEDAISTAALPTPGPSASINSIFYPASTSPACSTSPPRHLAPART